MSNKMSRSLLTIPVELVYRILDNVSERTIFLSLRNVCTRLNTIIDTYHRYQVNFSFISEVRFSSFSTCRSFNNESYFQFHSLFSFILDRLGKRHPLVHSIISRSNTSWNIHSHFLEFNELLTATSFQTE